MGDALWSLLLAALLRKDIHLVQEEVTGDQIIGYLWTQESLRKGLV